jgi:hypothetical protein
MGLGEIEAAFRAGYERGCADQYSSTAEDSFQQYLLDLAWEKKQEVLDGTSQTQKEL